MAPHATHSIDHTPEYEAFIRNLRTYHENRGTHFEPEPKVGHVHVDLLKLFNLINENGGYDKVSDEKLAWRNMVNHLGLFSSNEASAAYSLKVAYYKNLAAYEISTIHKKEPPPPQILEHISAKGGNLLTRTLENFGHRIGLNSGSHADSGDEATPSKERRADDTPGSGTGRASRGLREAPAQRVIFQPDTGSSRATRQVSGQHPGAGISNNHTPSHASHPHGSAHLQSGHHMNPQQNHRGASASFNPQGSDVFSAVIQSFEPRPPIPIHLHPVETPGNSPAEFARRHRLLKLHAAGLTPGQMALRPPPLPGFEGPNIYVRCLNALRSKIPEEEAYALNHLVKISYERGDRYKFDAFAGLAEGLTEKALEVGRLFYDVNWVISYDPESDGADVGELDGVNGTGDILERIATLKQKDSSDNIQPEEFIDQLVMVTEAALTIRNMVTLPDNAFSMADFPPVRDLICIILHLPDIEGTIELKHCALDMAEQLTPWLILQEDDPLYRTLLLQLESVDRGMVLTALRALGRISMNHSESNKLSGVPPHALRNIMEWLLLNDDELMDACLDFLYQYTAIVANVETLLKSIRTETLVTHLVRLLSHGAKRGVKDVVIVPERTQPPADRVANVPRDLLDRLVAKDEPDRCYAWLRCFFEEDPESSITQIAIWQAYQNAFQAAVQQQNRSMLGAADFIRNVTHVYANAAAQIQREGERGEIQKFIIKGIRARPRPVNEKGEDYIQCRWRLGRAENPNTICGWLFADPQKMYYHIAKVHLGEIVDEAGHFANHEKEFRCVWFGCSQYLDKTSLPLRDAMTHMKTHIVAAFAKTQHATAALQGNGDATPASSNKRARRSYVVPAKTIGIPFEETVTTRDERNPNAPPQAAGIPLSAVLVLRNIARNVVKTEAEEELQKEAEDRGGAARGGWNERLFRPVLPRLYEVLAENKAFAPNIMSLLELIRDE
jgi:chromatin structure-remodeling complex subunit RSC9